MCEFISWVETPERLYYLTDEQVFSVDGQLRLRDTQDNDILGHGAIRRFYYLMNREGKDLESKYFWEDEKLPDELKAKLASWKTIDATWGRMLREALTASDIVRLVNARRDIANGVWSIVLERTKRRSQLLAAFLGQCDFGGPFVERAFVLLESDADGLALLAGLVYDGADDEGIQREARRRFARLSAMQRRTALLAYLKEDGGDHSDTAFRRLLRLQPGFRQLMGLWTVAGCWNNIHAQDLLAAALARHPQATRSSLERILTEGSSWYAFNQAWARYKGMRPTRRVLLKLAGGWWVSAHVQREAKRMLKERERK